ncbi:MAG: DNA polymerase III subunit alpha [Candidatus Wildermuthbacteria bacterium RIFCSPLOWO2_02_FULL_47_9c]|uniref:DNA polymerase III subunit alpha n=2 Tax=Parcubacteria group TaxID=1794811 RepID=A0A837IP55_9BACT|nr:MAG: polymerase III, alpha subunit protein [Candidatus Yanofskybacteria bacterium GW2011_GWC1_48_11]KKW04632.1 MAG: polymerase III catalytic subunit, DnaE type protein [Parcubacteria group bacterium GW2011_GWB1_49_12]KKW09067.1 MAG: polymerase III catalytic subunit, DnaE type protein [Parcubacteria group bacterium GW2011_GWA1_49_26]KKW13619.1 MAG: polymerase III catalytic subunit, DnaE type protein [Parcubacteria group bacterium GW2011_GWA2_50_10]OHA61117.1 MAG: DNA polymerase III subunit al
MPGKFTHLHIHSHYSLLDGLPKIDQLLDRVQELGMDSVALTDHGNLYGAVEFYKKAKERSIKPILGCEMYVAREGMLDKRPGVDDTIYHIILLVKNAQGYKNLIKLLTRAHLEGFYYKPRVDETLLAKHAEGLIALSACLAGKISQLILANKMEEARNAALNYEKMFGRGNFYLELQRHPNISEQTKVNGVLLEISKTTGIPVVATADSHYLRKEDAEAQDVLMLINTNAKRDDPERLSMKGEDFSLKSAQEMTELFSDIPEALENTQKIAAACNAELELHKNLLPEFPLPEGKTADEYLRELCLAGLEAKPQYKDSKEARDRLGYELDVIRQTGFAAYFLIVQDFVNWAKQNRIVVGPGRGSAAGSLVAYLLKITNVDPLRYNLLFERFLNPERVSRPDIDLDFADTRRDEVIEYVAQKYGRDRVAQIITFGTMASRAVVRDVGRALGYEYGYCDRVAKLIPFGYSLAQSLEQVDDFRQLYESDEQAKRLIDLGKKLEGVARHASTHACGVVISSDPLDERVPLQHPTQNDVSIVTQYEMHSVEDIGLLKMDFLGLKNLTIIEETLKRIYAIHGKNIDIDAVPLDDPKVYTLLRQGDTTGVFQLESGGMRRYLRELKPSAFEDIIAMVALYRPGPMELIPDYIARKAGKKEIVYLHPKLEPILRNTYGIAVYQEQILQVARDLAGFSYGEADILRKAIGKKIKGLLEEQKAKFVERAIANGTSKKIAEKVFDFIEPFASYGFNRSHAACYATIAYQTAWLKANYPLEFMSALLTSERADVERTAFLIEETRKMGIEVLPPDVNESFAFFSVVPEKKQIRFGLLAIKNVGEGIVASIIQERKEHGPYLSIHDFVSRVATKDLNKKSMESMIKAGVFDQFGERNQLLHNMERLLGIARENQKNKTNGQKGLFDAHFAPSEKTSFALEAAEPAKETEMLSWEKELLGLYVTSHPLKGIKNILESRALAIRSLEEAVQEIHNTRYKFQFSRQRERLRIGGIISSVKRIVTKAGKPMLFMRVEDLTDRIEVVVFPSVIERYPSALQENKIVFITGRLDHRGGEKKFLAEEIEEILTA